jgi:protein Mpv17
MGAVIGVLNHYWYALLDSKLPGTTAKTIIKKILLDQSIASPLFMSIYFIGK